MNTTTAADRSAEIERYLAGVAAALVDLPEQVRQELLEDLPDHLAEIAADDPASLDSRLGPPPAYAAELRAAVGIETAKPERGADRWKGFVAAARPHARTFDEKTGRLIGYDRLTDFLVQLRPAWWVLRGYLLGIFLLNRFAGGHDIFPQDSDAGLLGWPLVLMLVGLSIRLGRRPLHLVRRFEPKWLGVGAVVLLLAAWSINALVGNDDIYHPSSPPAMETHYGAEEVYVYTEAGQPVTDVRVYSRNGDAVPIGVPIGCDQPEYGFTRERRGCIPADGDQAPVVVPGDERSGLPSAPASGPASEPASVPASEPGATVVPSVSPS